MTHLKHATCIVFVDVIIIIIIVIIVRVFQDIYCGHKQEFIVTKQC